MKLENTLKKPDTKGFMLCDSYKMLRIGKSMYRYRWRLLGAERTAGRAMIAQQDGVSFEGDEIF